MSVIAAWILATVLAAEDTAQKTTAPPPPPQDVTILVWSHLRGNPAPNLFATVDSLRRLADQAHHPLLAVDGGETIFGSDLAFLTRGQSQFRILGRMNPDAVLLGGSDFVWTRSRLDSVMAGHKFPILTANLLNALDDKPYGGRASLIWDFDGLRIGAIGISEPDISSDDRPSRTIDLRSIDPTENVKKELADLRAKGAKAVVLLSHAGEELDRALVAQIPDLDVVVETHGVVRDTSERIGKTWFIRLKGGPDNLGQIDLHVSDDAVGALASRAALVPKARLSSARQSVFDSLAKLLKTNSDSVLETLPDAWPKTKREGMLGNFLADAIRVQSGAQVALFPAAAIRNGLPKGKITQGDIWKVLGEPRQVSVFELPGSDLEKLLRFQMTRPKEYLYLSGATCTSDSSAFGGSWGQVLIDGKPVLRGDRYKVAIPQDFRDRPFDLTGFSMESLAPEYMEQWDRDLIIAHIRKHGMESSIGRVPAMWGASR